MEACLKLNDKNKQVCENIIPSNHLALAQIQLNL